MSKPKAKKQTIELPDVMASELVKVINTAHEDGKLITGFVCLLETFDGRKKSIKIQANADMPQHSVFGIINFVTRLQLDVVKIRSTIDSINSQLGKKPTRKR